MKKILAILLVVLTLAAFSGCVVDTPDDGEVAPETENGTTQVDPITHLRIGYQPSTHQIAEMVAMDKGWWKDDLAEFGIAEVTEYSFPSGPPEMQSMMAGHLDIAYVGVAPPITAIAQGLEAKIVAGVQVQGSDLVLRPKIADNYTSPADLRGLKIATFPPGSIQDGVLKKFLMDNNVSIDDVEIVPMGPGDAMTAISANAVDGVFLPHPGPAVIELDGNGMTVASSGEMWQDHACCCLIVSDELIENHPDMVKEIIRIHIKATDYLIENPNESAEIFAEKTGFDADKVLYSFERWDGRWISDPRIELNCTIEFAEVDYELGYIDRLLTADDIFDMSFYDAVKGE
ncbi:MAG: ABC transporter substrate-binding protein [Euryarchaeota archaeon]|nr:ABC transporter substrate-binding protein [Euryarchaeota archaeon]